MLRQRLAAGSVQEPLERTTLKHPSQRPKEGLPRSAPGALLRRTKASPACGSSVAPSAAACSNTAAILQTRVDEGNRSSISLGRFRRRCRPRVVDCLIGTKRSQVQSCRWINTPTSLGLVFICSAISAYERSSTQRIQNAVACRTGSFASSSRSRSISSFS